jgi:hypothetical protein
MLCAEKPCSILFVFLLLVVTECGPPFWIDPKALADAAGFESDSRILKTAFVCDRYQNDKIYVMDSDGSGQINLANHAAQDFLSSVVARWHQDRLSFIPNRE